MELLFGGISLYIGFLILSLFVALVLWHVRFLLVRVQGPEAAGPLRYIPFLKGLFTRWTMLTIFVFVPLGLTLALFGSSFMAAQHHGSSLRNKLQDSTRLTIRTGGFCHREPDGEVPLYETHDSDEIREFVGRLSFRLSIGGLSCACCGEMTFEFYNGAEKSGAFSLHHDTRIRLENASSGDVFLTKRSCQLLDQWLTEKGVRAIQKELDAKRAEEMKRRLEELDRT